VEGNPGCRLTRVPHLCSEQCQGSSRWGPTGPLPLPAFTTPEAPQDSSSERAPPAQVPTFRAQFQAQEDIVEEKLVADHGLRVEHDTIGGVPVVVVGPHETAERMRGKAVLNIHGAGFVMGTARERTALLAAAELGVTVYSVDYTLSPEAAFPTAIEQSLAVYRELAARIGAGNLVGVASSSGEQIILRCLIAPAGRSSVQC